ncbi:kynureninase [Salinisphaera sp. Q1T1-3]|uniref:kynureninase n=1 Tax=Salinisphaera sp. Q1T1-3 TaxID=2321229 RepID=UPI000E736368|nr:kynureninase [Salinisphaera sp. Q1T1-3]RJS95298.1 kynureninase [Salinisphaera sp. Q1T1-3]
MTPAAHARRLDAADPLADRRDHFVLPNDTIYLDGNSLGPLTHAAQAAVADTVAEEWGRGLIGSWNDAGWVTLPGRVGAAIAPLIGAAPDDVVCCDSTSVNLYKVLAVALSIREGRGRLVAERDNFPTDLYIAEQAAARAPGACRVAWLTPDESIADTLDEDVAVVLLTHIDYRTGEMHDMADITAAAHAVGAVVVWDLAHSAGAVPLALRDAEVDFAVGCGYKYLNGGPGAPAFIYAHPRHRHQIAQPLAGWFGHAEPFAFEPAFRPRADIAAFLTGTPPIIAMRALEAALGLWQGIDMQQLREKSIALCHLFIETVEANTDDEALTLASPRDAAHRGSQVSFRHPEAYAVMQALIDAGVIGDMRAPDIMRFGFAPLYTRYTDVVAAAERLVSILARRTYDDPRYRAQAAVT